MQQPGTHASGRAQIRNGSVEQGAGPFRTNPQGRHHHVLHSPTQQKVTRALLDAVGSRGAGRSPPRAQPEVQEFFGSHAAALQIHVAHHRYASCQQPQGLRHALRAHPSGQPGEPRQDQGVPRCPQAVRATRAGEDQGQVRPSTHQGTGGRALRTTATAVMPLGLHGGAHDHGRGTDLLRNLQQVQGLDQGRPAPWGFTARKEHENSRGHAASPADHDQP